jgi:hypothetical protein
MTPRGVDQGEQEVRKMIEEDGQDEATVEYSEKMMGSTTRPIHDGTFPPVVSLILGLFVQ